MSEAASQAAQADPSQHPTTSQHPAASPSADQDADPLGLGDAQPQAGIGSIADDVLAEVGERAGQGGQSAAQSGGQPATGGGDQAQGKGKTSNKKWGAWTREPLDNFELDWRGKVKKHRNGRPVRKAGEPREAQPGDRLADGSIYQVDPKGEQAGQPGGVFDPTQAQAQPEGAAQAVHPAMGQKLAEVVCNVAEKVGGESWKLSQAEREALKEAAGGASGGIRMHPGILLLIVAGAIFAPRLVRSWLSAQRKQTDSKATNKGDRRSNGEADSHDGRRPNNDGQNPNGKTVGFKYEA